jgi:hypothetical protein
LQELEVEEWVLVEDLDVYAQLAALADSRERIISSGMFDLIILRTEV